MDRDSTESVMDFVESPYWSDFEFAHILGISILFELFSKILPKEH